MVKDYIIYLKYIYLKYLEEHLFLLCQYTNIYISDLYWGIMSSDIFQEVSEENVPKMLDALKQDWPKHYNVST